MPLVYDYGIGGVLAFALTYYMNKNWNIGICNEGLIYGSKLDSKLIRWNYIKTINYLSNSIEVKFIEGYPLDLINISSLDDINTFEKLLKYKISN